MLEAVDGTASFPTPPDAWDVLDVLQHMIEEGEIEKCIVIFQRPDGNYGWLTSSFNTKTEQLGLVELVKLDMFHNFSHEGGET